MATLNGQQINNTYQSLVKFVDNGNAAATLKELTDGQGNELGILVNTTGDLTIEGNATIQGVIDSTGANKIAFFYADQSSFPSAATYHGAIAHSHADGKLYFAHSGSWIELANSADVTAVQVDDVTIELNGSSELSVKDDSISSTKLSNEFKTATTLTPTSGAQVIDFTSAQVFSVVMTEDTTFTFSNDSVGMIKDVLLSGNFSPTFPAGVNTIVGVYDGSVENLIQILTTGTGEYWMSISKAQ